MNHYKVTQKDQEGRFQTLETTKTDLRAYLRAKSLSHMNASTCRVERISDGVVLEEYTTGLLLGSDTSRR